MSLKATAHSLRALPTEQLVHEYAPFCKEQFDPKGQPVVVAAHNEEIDLPVTLVSLAMSKERLFPIIAENGSSDATAEVARRMGAVVVSLEQTSKVAALQAGTALGLQKSQKILYTDADTLIGGKWSRTLLSAVSRDTAKPTTAFGRVLFTHGDSRFVDAARGLNNGIKATMRRFTDGMPIPLGANMAVDFAGSRELIANYMRLNPNVFGGEEAAIIDIVRMSGGVALQCVDTAAAVRTRGDRFGTVSQCLKVKFGLIDRQETYGNIPFEEYNGSNLFKSANSEQAPLSA